MAHISGIFSDKLFPHDGDALKKFHNLITWASFMIEYQPCVAVYPW
jgi:hypothetical protein